MKTGASQLFDILTEYDATGRAVSPRAARLLIRTSMRHRPEYQALTRKAEAKLPNWKRAIIERIEGAVQKPLAAYECQCIAEALRDLWLSKDYRAFDRQHKLPIAEHLLEIHSRDVVARLFRKSDKALDQWLKRERAKRKRLRR
jgi:hypothetical protein